MPASRPTPGRQRQARLALALLVNGLVIVWAIRADWSLFSVLLFYGFESIALSLGATVIAFRRAATDRLAPPLGAILLLVLLNGLAVYATVSAFGTLTYGAELIAWVRLQEMLPALAILAALHGLVVPLIDGRQSREEDVRPITPPISLAIARALTLIGVLIATYLLMAAFSASLEEALIGLMLAKLVAEIAVVLRSPAG